MEQEVLMNGAAADNLGKRIVKAVTGFRGATLVFIILGISIIMTFVSPAFMTESNIKTTFIGLAGVGIVVIGMTVALVSGGVDLSVGSVYCLGGVVTGKFLLLGANVWVAILAGLMTGVLCGLFMGLMIGKVGLNPLITSLAMMGMARGLAYVITQGTPLSLYRIMPKSFAFLGSGEILGFLTVFVFIFICLTLLCDFLFRRSGVFRKVFYTGSNEKAAILSGINTGTVKVGVFMFSAMLASLAGILSVARFKVAAPGVGIGMELECISAAVIGGASLTGGEGNILGSVLGIIMLALIRNVLVLENVSVYWQQFVAGAILIIAVTIDHVSQQRRKARLGGGE